MNNSAWLGCVYRLSTAATWDWKLKRQVIRHLYNTRDKGDLWLSRGRTVWEATNSSRSTTRRSSPVHLSWPRWPVWWLAGRSILFAADQPGRSFMIAIKYPSHFHASIRETGGLESVFALKLARNSQGRSHSCREERGMEAGQVLPDWYNFPRHFR